MNKIVCDRGWHVIALGSDYCQCKALIRVKNI